MDALNVALCAEHLVYAMTAAGVVTFVAGVVLGLGWSFVDRFAERCADRWYAARRDQQLRRSATER